jgi:two-component system, NarL family, sensor histidine kinase DesK
LNKRRRFLFTDEVLGWTPYAWLLYLPIFVLDPIASTRAGDAPFWLWPITILGLIVFLISYVLGYRPPYRRLPYVALLQTGLGVAFAPINTGAAVFFVYATSFGAQVQDTRLALRLILSITCIGGLTAYVTQAPSYFWISAVALAPLIGAINLHFARVGRTQRKLKLAQDEVEHLAAVAERERIARDLHDVLGHTLSLIILKSELAAKLADRDPARAAREIRDVETVARQALQEVRDAIRGYRATLADEVERARSLLKMADIEADFDIEQLELERAQAETLALALREAVTNVVRHARAHRCTVSVRAVQNNVVLEVIDDGRGGRDSEGAGLRGMRERIEVLGGTLERVSNRGVQLVVTLPLRAPEPATVPLIAADEMAS